MVGQDSEFLLQEYRVYRCPLVVPDSLWLEFKLRVWIYVSPLLEFFLDACACDWYRVVWQNRRYVVQVLSWTRTVMILCLDADVLMELPELYRYGREGKWFGLKWFTVYMFDGVMQVCSSPYRFRWNLILFLFLQSAVIYFLIVYTYTTVSARLDGWDVALYEFSTVSFLCEGYHTFSHLRLLPRQWFSPLSWQPTYSMGSTPTFGQLGFSLQSSLVSLCFGYTRWALFDVTAV